MTFTNWPTTPWLRAATVDLYGSVWETLPRAIQTAAGWGADWFALSRPFLHVENNRVLAHVGLCTCHFVISGAQRQVSALHGVCVAPDSRGKGLARRCIEAALEELDAAGTSPVILWSTLTDFYGKFGFEPKRESAFTTRIERAPTTPARPLELTSATDLRTLQTALAERTPVNSHLAAADDGSHFLLDLAIRRTWGLDKLALTENAIIVYNLDQGQLLIEDVIANAPLSAAEIYSAITHIEGPLSADVTFLFEPELVQGVFTPAPHPEEDTLLVRGDWPAVDQRPFALSGLTRT